MRNSQLNKIDTFSGEKNSFLVSVWIRDRLSDIPTFTQCLGIDFPFKKYILLSVHAHLLNKCLKLFKNYFMETLLK